MSLARRVDALAAAVTACFYATSTPSPRRPRRRRPKVSGSENAPLDHVDVAVPIGVEHGERRLEARRDQQVLEVFIAAVDEEFYHFLCA